MSKQNKSTTNTKSNGDNAGFDAQLRQMPDAHSSSIDAACYKYASLHGLVLNYISDALEERLAVVLDEKSISTNPKERRFQTPSGYRQKPTGRI